MFFSKQEEDISEKVLVALLRPADLDSGGESISENSTGLVRQRTMTLSVHTDEDENAPGSTNESHLERQKTVTLTKSSVSMSESDRASSVEDRHSSAKSHIPSDDEIAAEATDKEDKIDDEDKESDKEEQNLMENHSQAESSDDAEVCYSILIILY